MKVVVRPLSLVWKTIVDTMSSPLLSSSSSSSMAFLSRPTLTSRTAAAVMLPNRFVSSSTATPQAAPTTATASDAATPTKFKSSPSPSSSHFWYASSRTDKQQRFSTRLAIDNDNHDYYTASNVSAATGFSALSTSTASSVSNSSSASASSLPPAPSLSSTKNDSWCAKTEKTKNCQTCSCDDADDERQEQQQQELNAENHPCGVSSAHEEELPPPMGEPAFSVRRRVLPEKLVALNTPLGRKRLMQSLQDNTAAAYIALTEHFQNQSDPAFCGITSLQMVLNAFAVDPNVRWRGGWRYFGNEETVLSACCITMERVQRIGITIEEFARLAKCKGLTVKMYRPKVNELISLDLEEATSTPTESTTLSNSSATLTDFRRHVERLLCQHHSNCKHSHPHNHHHHHATHSHQQHPVHESTKRQTPDGVNLNHHETDESNVLMNGAIVVSYGRSALGQTGEGHYSPLAAYHEESDSVLVLDVARFKYQPYWVTVTDLYHSMECLDPVTKQPRGWFELGLPDEKQKRTFQQEAASGHHNLVDHADEWMWPGAVIKDEDKRPAHLVPLAAGSTTANICPVQTVKIDYCQASSSTFMKEQREKQRRAQKEQLEHRQPLSDLLLQQQQQNEKDKDK